MRILFLGEGPLEASAQCGAAILNWSKIRFDHLPDQTSLPRRMMARTYDAAVLSDYRYSSWSSAAISWLINAVHSGMGLCMIGGFASFTGLVGRYSKTKIEELLPVRCLPKDDRQNAPAVLVGPGVEGVVVNGYQRCKVKPASRTWLQFRDLHFIHGRPKLGARYPALVTGVAGKGRTVAFLTDCAPHWAGGLVDWGKHRTGVRVGPTQRVEVGERYLKFFRHWLRWCANKA